MILVIGASRLDRKTHHRAAVDNALLWRSGKPRMSHQPSDRCAQAAVILRSSERLTGQRYDAMCQRLAIDNRAFGRNRGAGVHTDQSDISGDTAGRDLLSGQYFDDLLFSTRGILGGEGRQLNLCS